MKSLFHLLLRKLPVNRAQRIVLLLLIVLLTLLVVFLIDAKKPWDSKITERIAQNSALRVKDYIVIGLWWGALANAVITTLLLTTFRWWKSALISAPDPGTWISSTARQRLLWLAGVAGAMVLCAVLCWPRMSLSLWGDEDYSMRQVIVGNYKQLDDGSVELRRLTLPENLWTYKGPNNHFLFTIPARITHDIWRKFFFAEELEFNEFALRIPAMVAGLLAIAALALLVARMGFPVAGILAAYLAATHPWLIKYTSEARGYSMVLLFAALGAYCLLEALRREKLRWWVAFAFCNFCFMYAYPAALYLACSLTLAAVLAIFSDKGWSRLAWHQLVRLLFSGALSAMLFIQLITPTIPQMALYLQRERASGEQGLDWLLDFWGWLSTGMSWKDWASDNPLAHSVQDLHSAHPVLHGFVVIGIPLIAAIGLLRLCLSGRTNALVAAAFLLAPSLAYYQATHTNHLLYLWYLIYSLPLFLACVALGLDAVGSLQPKVRVVSSAIMLLLFLGFYIPATSSQLQTMQTHAIEPQRDSVLLTRSSLNPYNPANAKILTCTVAFGTKMYDPLQVELESVAHLTSLMEKADHNDWPLYVNFGSEGFCRAVAPDLTNLIELSGKFKLVERLYGMDVQNTRVVYRYLNNAR